MTQEADAHRARPRWRRVLGGFWGQLLLAFVVVGLILSLIAKPYVVPSGSMSQTLEVGDRILVNRLAFVGGPPRTGDVVVFDADDSWETPAAAPANPVRAVLRWIGEVTGFGPSGPHTLVKRVIGSAGQVVECCDVAGDILVDGQRIDEPYVYNDLPFESGTLDCRTTPRSARCFDAVTVPAGSYLVLGDNRGASRDSSFFCRSPEPREECWRWATDAGIVGRVVAILWPIPRWAMLGRPSVEVGSTALRRWRRCSSLERRRTSDGRKHHGNAREGEAWISARISEPPVGSIAQEPRRG